MRRARIDGYQRVAAARGSVVSWVARWRRVLDWRTGVAFGLPLVLYVLTLAPTIYNLDSAELTTAAATGGIVRATGYPLYLLLGRVWSRLPIRDVGYRMNLFSAWHGALTVALAERVLRRLGVGPWAALGALGLLATAPFFWALSLIAEVYTLHTALMAAIILALLSWSEDPTPRRLAVAALLVGLSAGNHAATILLVPGAVFYLLATAGRRVLAPRALAWAAGGLLAGLSVYLYLPLRYGAGPAFNYAGRYQADGSFVPVDLQSLGGLWWLVSGRAFSGQMFAYRGARLWREVGRCGAQLWRAFFAVGLGPGLVGLVSSRRRGVSAMLLVMFVCNAGFYVGYRVVDKDMMFLPVYLVWALWLGLGYQRLMEWMASEGDERIRRWGIRLLRAAMVGAVVLAAVWTWDAVDLSDDWSARSRGEAVLEAAAPDALILGWWDTIPVVEYLQLVEGQRPDVEALNCFLIGRRDLAALVRQELERRPIYVDETARDRLGVSGAEPAGVLYRLELPRSDPVVIGPE